MFATLLALATAPLQPAGKWTVSYNAGDCTLQRSFGDAAKPVVFGFKPAPTRISGDLVLLLPSPEKGVRRGKGRIKLGPGDRAFSVDWASGSLPNDRRGYRMQVEQPFWDALATADSISFELGKDAPMVAALGSMAAPLKAVQVCGDDLLRTWGVDPANVVRLDNPSGLANWFGSDAYPSEAQRANEEGRVVSLTLFDRAGKPTQCNVAQPSGSLALDQQTCSIMMRRGRVKADPVAPERRFLLVPVRWVLPGA